MPELTLCRLFVDLKVIKLGDLILELDDKSDFRGSAEIPHDEETDHFKESISCEHLLIASELQEIIKLYR